MHLIYTCISSSTSHESKATEKSQERTGQEEVQRRLIIIIIIIFSFLTLLPQKKPGFHDLKKTTIKQ